MPDAPRLKKSLTLFDVYAISTGAMFSSGFFLLPGLATAQAGPATVLAYFLAGVFILPAMFSAAELSTAMPRAGGAYYFLDRSLGPLAETGIGARTGMSVIALQRDGEVTTDLSGDTVLAPDTELVMMGDAQQRADFARVFGS